MNTFAIFEDHESNVRSYCRSFPAVLSHAVDARIFDVSGKDYIDFFAGAGALNYGHNNADILRHVLKYLQQGGIVHSLDFYSSAKAQFIERFVNIILQPRGLQYRLQFTGPTGANAVEAAIKLARRVTGRTQVVAFTNAFHGVSLGALAATANIRKREAASVPLTGVNRMPYDAFFGGALDSAEIVEKMYRTPGNGLDKPAAFIVEVVQGEGGLNVASNNWLTRIGSLAKELGAILIVDEIQTGCGRTGTFFGFEDSGLVPDIVCLSKSLGGIGFPIAMNLIKPELDQWEPGEHNGTFRGNNLAFVAGSAALDYWTSEFDFTAQLREKAKWLRENLTEIAMMFAPGTVSIRGKGLLQGLAFSKPQLASQISERGFEHGVIAETCGPNDEVLKIMPPLTIDQDTLQEGFNRLRTAIRSCLMHSSAMN